MTRQSVGMHDVSPANEATISSYDALTDDFLSAWDPEGDAGRRLLLNPTFFRLLGDLTGRRVLDAGCGQGYLSRLLANRGAEVVGVEPAARLVIYARRVEQERRQGVQYLQRDLSRLGDAGRPFDAVVANMVLLDIADWQSALANCVAALKPGGLLVYSLHHPCWVAGAAEEWPQRKKVELCEYLDEYEVRGGVGGSVNYHRPLSSYVNETIRLGCRIVEIAEPRLLPEQIEDPSQEILTHIPNYIVVSACRAPTDA